MAAQLDALHRECVEAREPRAAKIAALALATAQLEITREFAQWRQDLFGQDMDVCFSWAEQELNMWSLC